MIDPLNPEKLYGACDQQQFSFQTTDELESLTGIVGQPRVIGAVEFGIGIRQQGYNLFVSRSHWNRQTLDGAPYSAGKSSRRTHAFRLVLRQQL